MLGQGAAPAGTDNERQAAAWVRGMFGQIVPRYDLLNHLLSMNIDRYWRARTVARVSHVLEKPGASVLDVCCGTGDLMLALGKRSRGTVYGSDFCHPMLVAARQKIERRGAHSPLFEADALDLPLPDASLDLVTVAFGFRNLANYQRGLEQLLRILKPGGLLAILEFSTPPNPLLSRLYGFYSRAILPTLGGWIDGLDKVGAANWSWEWGCYEEEGFNGWGYRAYGEPSPYLFGGTNIQKSGKFTSDHGFDRSVMDTQLGVIPMMLRMVQLRPALALPFPFPAATGVPIAIPAPRSATPDAGGEWMGTYWAQRPAFSLTTTRVRPQRGTTGAR